MLAKGSRSLPLLNAYQAFMPTRGAYFAALVGLGFANGLVARIRDAIADDPVNALLGTFDISVLVWLAFAFCMATMLKDRGPVRRGDLRLGATALVAFMLPVDWLSWIALTATALYLLRREASAAGAMEPPAPLRRAGWVLLATTGAMFWGRVLLVTTSDFVLQADAAAVSWLVGAPRLGNTLPFADGGGYVWIAAPCSSLSNVSLAILCWVLFSQWRHRRWSFAGAAWCLLAIVSVIAINALRIGLVVLYHDYFDLLHGPAGTAAAAWLTVAVTVAICAWGTRQVSPGPAGLSSAPRPAPR